VSRRIDAVQAPVIPILGEWIRQSPGTISLGQGMVGYGPPPAALEAIPPFLTRGDAHRYGPVEGLPALVDALAQKLTHENHLPLDRSRIVATAGGNMAFMNALLAVADPGDEVILQAPFYFNHEMAVVMADCRPVVVPTDARYQLQLDRIEAAITPRTRAIVTISPNNPSGAVYPETDLRAVNALCASRGIWHIHDEVYEYFTYGDARHFSPGSVAGADAHTISLYSLSKAYGFASWRIGYMVIPDALWMAVNKIQDTLLICAPHVSQAAAVGALSAGRAYCDAHVATLAAVREQVLAQLGALAGIAEAPSADGAFYCLLRVRTAIDAMTLAERLIREHKVATVPGTAFGLADATYLRISYGALAGEKVEEGMGRLVAGIKAICSSPDAS
jgi:aspartate/methionine/tyrosine aminotransferase